MRNLLPLLAKSITAVLLVLVVTSAFSSIQAANAKPLRVLIFTGQNNHKWQETTPRIKEILTSSGRFTVEVTDRPDQGNAEQFGQYDVLLSDWNAWGNAKIKEWPKPIRSAFLDFVRKGGGHVVVHAGGTSFFDWDDYQNLIGGTWGKNTGHGAVHNFKVKPVDPNHPITQGLAPFNTIDELWHRMATRPGIHVLATAFSAKDKGGSGNDEPVAFTTQFGQGRCFNLVLGHNARAMDANGFQVLLGRGTEWAATGKVTLPAAMVASGAQISDALKSVASYKFGDSRKPLANFEKLVTAAANDPVARKPLEEQLVKILSSDATVEAKRFALWQLSLIGSAAAVPALEKALADPELTYYARLALERIPDDEAATALQAALKATVGRDRNGVIQSLGVRRATTAISDLARLAADEDRDTAQAAIKALGQIGTAQAAKALQSVAGNVPESLRLPLADSVIRCAEELLVAGQTKEAAALLKPLLEASKPSFIRSSAFTLYAQSPGTDGGREISRALGGSDSDMQAAALRALRQSEDSALLTSAAGELAGLPVGLQVQLLALCSERGDASLLNPVRAAASSSHAEVRLAAIQALGSVGNAKIVPWITGMIVKADESERKAVAEMLRQLPGNDVDAAIASELKNADSQAKVILIQALVARSAQSATPALLSLTTNPNADVRRQAIAATGKLGDDRTATKLVQQLEKAAPEDRSRIEGGLVEIGERTQSTMPVIQALPNASPEVRSHLVGVLGAVGGEAALNTLRAELKSAKAGAQLTAVRALSNWPDAAPMDDLSALAATSDNAQIKALALRTVARMAPQAKDRPDAAASSLKRLLPVAGNANERQALITALGSIPSLIALQSLQPLLKDAESRDAAVLAVLQVSELTHPWHRAEVQAAIEELRPYVKQTAAQNRLKSLMIEMQSLPNLAKGGTATSPDGLEKDGDASGDQAAIDGDLKTYWDEVNGKKLYRLHVELQRPSKVDFLRLTAYQHHSYAPKDFEVLCNGKVVKTIRNAQYENNVLSIEFPSVQQCRTVELKITGYYGASPAIRELEIYGNNPGGATSKTGMQWKQTDTSLALIRNGKTLWQFNHDPKEGKPYFHPLALPGGAELTALRPDDHVWHRAFWWSWKFINGVNYWEEDPKTLKSAGLTDVVSVKANPKDDGSALIELQLAYHLPGKEPLLNEDLVLDISAPKKDGSYAIDWSTKFTATGKEVLLDRTPIPGEPKGVGYGGYAGLSLRLAASTRPWVYTSSEGKTGMKLNHGKPARWIDLSGDQGGVTMFDHPKNMRHPTPWYVNQGMPYFSPAILFNESLTLKANRSLKLNYRLLVHDGAMNKAALDNEWKKFGNQSRRE